MLPGASRSTRATSRRFKPHPARELDATGVMPSSWQASMKVSTLIQPESWMLPGDGVCASNASNKFQPSSRPRAGCYMQGILELTGDHMFQPSSSPRAGCYKARDRDNAAMHEFQPSSRPRAGCYAFVHQVAPGGRDVSTLIP